MAGAASPLEQGNGRGIGVDEGEQGGAGGAQPGRVLDGQQGGVVGEEFLVGQKLLRSGGDLREADVQAVDHEEVQVALHRVQERLDHQGVGVVDLQVAAGGGDGGGSDGGAEGGAGHLGQVPQGRVDLGQHLELHEIEHHTGARRAGGRPPFRPGAVHAVEPESLEGEAGGLEDLPDAVQAGAVPRLFHDGEDPGEGVEQVGLLVVGIGAHRLGELVAGRQDVVRLQFDLPLVDQGLDLGHCQGDRLGRGLGGRKRCLGRRKDRGSRPEDRQQKGK